ncbi:hypothetical protein NDU88_008633 [Pleurodeles waltl]|uniref:Uncharacterized protein n=1 Tax=Pleurodeles waltl TaxID=8319 RepID=A0AAV7PTN3_PLEWA|nr:hypothetical protein NDU88_008633 [Pleurodeles waltl]
MEGVPKLLSRHIHRRNPGDAPLAEYCLSCHRGTYEGVAAITTEAMCTSEGADRLEEPGSKAHDSQKMPTGRRGREDLQQTERDKKTNGEDKDVSSAPEMCLFSSCEERNLDC